MIRLVSTHGVKIEPPKEISSSGSQSYVAEHAARAGQGLEAKGYLPYRESSHWRQQWNHALYHASIDVSEQQEGSYLSSANRLTRIEARLTLTSSGQTMPIWQTIPTARSTVPLPNCPPTCPAGSP